MYSRTQAVQGCIVNGRVVVGPCYGPVVAVEAPLHRAAGEVKRDVDHDHDNMEENVQDDSRG